MQTPNLKEEIGLNKNQENSNKENIEPIKKNENEINELYLKELDKETLLDLLDKQTSKDMEEYILNQIKLFEKEGASFSNEKLINEIAKYSNIEKTIETVNGFYVNYCKISFTLVKIIIQFVSFD